MIKLVILDIDGVMCDGKIYNQEHKTIGKKFSDLDFTAIKCFKTQNIPVVFLTSDEFNFGLSEKRNIPFYNGKIDGIINKEKIFETIKKDFQVNNFECVYIGDDIFDVPVLKKVTHSFCPNNSPFFVKKYCKNILNGKSGENLISEMFQILWHQNLVEEPDLKKLTMIDSEEFKK